ncbi:MAG: hypothetical protein J3K34DRAFT_428904 [Monoraphidium minutum]|nr:MAG: hypothetical protein J3K34DRAFT_428904 [Monoraphidium minutum]
MAPAPAGAARKWHARGPGPPHARGAAGPAADGRRHHRARPHRRQRGRLSRARFEVICPKRSQSPAPLGARTRPRHARGAHRGGAGRRDWGMAPERVGPGPPLRLCFGRAAGLRAGGGTRPGPTTPDSRCRHRQAGGGGGERPPGRRGEPSERNAHVWRQGTTNVGMDNPGLMEAEGGPAGAGGAGRRPSCVRRGAAHKKSGGGAARQPGVCAWIRARLTRKRTHAVKKAVRVGCGRGHLIDCAPERSAGHCPEQGICSAASGGAGEGPVWRKKRCTPKAGAPRRSATEQRVGEGMGVSPPPPHPPSAQKSHEAGTPAAG